MMMENERNALVEYGKKLITADLTKGTGGNLSILDDERKMIAITPSGFDFFETNPDDIVIIDFEGNLVEGNYKPSSEWRMHTEIYKRRKDMFSIIHGHTTFSTALACLGWELPPLHYMVGLAGNSVRCANYAIYGSESLAEIVSAELGDKDKAILLANHGIIGGGQDIQEAFNVIEEVEYCSKLYCISKSIGEPMILSDFQMREVREKFKSYGQ